MVKKMVFEMLGLVAVNIGLFSLFVGLPLSIGFFGLKYVIVFLCSSCFSYLLGSILVLYEGYGTSCEFRNSYDYYWKGSYKSYKLENSWEYTDFKKKR